MNFTWRLCEDRDLKSAVMVERAAMPRGPYLEDAWNYYKTNPGGLVCIEESGKLVGIGRLSVMPDKIGWLECLRVHPDYQNLGAGKLIYKAWLEIADKYGCRGLGMFTSTDNARSRGLAEKYGLTLSGSHQGYLTDNFEGAEPHKFRQVNWQRAQELIVPKREEYNGYMTTNRTFYRINEENARGFRDQGFVFEDKDTGDFVVLGARFQHYTDLHLIMMGGDAKRCIEFAKNMAKAKGVIRLSCMVCLENDKLINELTENGFTKSGPVFITKENIF